MKKLLGFTLVTGLLLVVLTVGALAAEPVSGIYDAAPAAGFAGSVSLQLYTAEKTEVTVPTNQDISTDATPVMKDVYADAEYLKLTCTGATPDVNYMIFVQTDTLAPSESNLVYINQIAANGDGDVIFPTVYPSSLRAGVVYHIFLSSAETSDSAPVKAYTEVASFCYYAPYTPGDINDDGAIDIDDAMAVINHIIERDVLTGTRYLAANVTDIGGADPEDVVDIDDAMEIINYIIDRPQYLTKNS